MESEELEQHLATLQKIAQQFLANSPESKTIELAAEALLFAFHKEAKAEFIKFLSNRDKPLTPEQILHLRAIGIDPISLEERV